MFRVSKFVLRYVTTAAPVSAGPSGAAAAAYPAAAAAVAVDTAAPAVSTFLPPQVAQQIRAAQQKAALAGQAPANWAIGARVQAVCALRHERGQKLRR